MTNDKLFTIKFTSQQLQDIIACVDYAQRQADTSEIEVLDINNARAAHRLAVQDARLSMLINVLHNPSYNDKTYALYTNADNMYHMLDITELTQTIIDETNENWLTAAIVTSIVKLATNGTGDACHWGSIHDCVDFMTNKI
jgi:hypothetical protein